MQCGAVRCGAVQCGAQCGAERRAVRSDATVQYGAERCGGCGTVHWGAVLSGALQRNAVRGGTRSDTKMESNGKQIEYKQVQERA